MSIVQTGDKLWVHIELTPESGPVKYEYDPQMGLVVDRFMKMPMNFPLPYGYAPGTLSDDGDALDVLVQVPHAVAIGSWITVRPVAVLVMEDEKGRDEKIIAVPISSVCSSYVNIKDLNDLSEDMMNKISEFFRHYKNLDQNKWTKIIGWSDVLEAKNIIEKAISSYKK